jgi:tetratricopeptide (TPR) repeat protein
MKVERDFARAEPDLLKAIELDPKLEPAYLLLAQLYVASNKQEQAIEKLTSFVDKNKDSGNKIAPALLQLALIQQSLSHFNEARDAYEKLLALNPNFVPALNNLAVLYSDNLGQLDKAYDLAKKARENAPNDPHSADTLGWILYKKGDFSDATPLLQESASKLPDQPDIQFHLGMAQYMLGRGDLARGALEKAAAASAQFPGKDEARKRLAVLAIDAQTTDAAVRKELQNYISEQPNDPEALWRLGQVQEREGVLDEAAKTYQKIIDSDPSFAPARRRLAILYSRRPNEEAKALDLAAKARQSYPDDPELTKTLGILNYQRGYYPQSAEMLKSAAAKTGDDPELLYYLGQTHHQLKQWNECKETLQRVLSMTLPPKLADEAKPALADCSAELKKSKGIESYRSGDYPQSVTLLKEAGTERKNDPELLYYLGEAYHQLKQSNECKDTLQRALNLNLPPDLADKAKHALADCS